MEGLGIFGKKKVPLLLVMSDRALAFSRHLCRRASLIRRKKRLKIKTVCVRESEVVKGKGDRIRGGRIGRQQQRHKGGKMKRMGGIGSWELGREMEKKPHKDAREQRREIELGGASLGV